MHNDSSARAGTERPQSIDPPVVASVVESRVDHPSGPSNEPPQAARPAENSATQHPASKDPTTTLPQPSLTAKTEVKQFSVTRAADATNASSEPAPIKNFRLRSLPFRLLAGAWQVASLFVLLACVAAIPILQLASLGYLLHSAGLLARGEPFRRCLPGCRLAGRIATVLLCTSLCWLPVWLVTDLAYTAQLLQPGSASSAVWRLGAFAITLLWLLHIAWAAARGGRFWHFLWPAPIKFLLRGWRVSTWRRLSDRLYEVVERCRIGMLWWLAARAAAGAILWTALPVTLIIAGLRSQELDAAGLVGLIGAVLMGLIMLYLPMAQVRFASTHKFSDLFNFREVRCSFMAAPLAHAFALLLVCLLSIPLYILRIEAAPAEFLWASSLVSILFTFPAKWAVGAAIGYGRRRAFRMRVPQTRSEPTPELLEQSHAPDASSTATALQSPHSRDLTPRDLTPNDWRAARRTWLLRWPARLIALASVVIYVGSLYIAQLVAGQGAFVIYFQHALLVPAPLISS